MKNFKKKIALLCVLTLVLSCIGPVMPTFAEETWHTGFSASGTSGGVTVSGSNVVIGTGAADASINYTKNMSIPEAYIVDITMRVTKYPSSGNLGFQIRTGSDRTGLYLSTDGIRPFGTDPVTAAYNVGTAWHNYKVYVKGDVHRFYVDGEFVTGGRVSVIQATPSVIFHMTGDGTMEVSDCSVTEWDEDWTEGFSISSGYNLNISNKTMTVGRNTICEKSVALPENYVAKLTMRIPEFDSSGHRGIQFRNGQKRTGLYISEDRVKPFSDNPAEVSFDIGTDWHEYRFHVSGDTHKIYIDKVLVAEGPTGTFDQSGSIAFFVSGAGSMEIKDLEITENETDFDNKYFPYYAGIETEYADEFTVDWLKPETYKDWTITETEHIYVNSDTGALTIEDEGFGLRESTYYHVGRSPLTTGNFDVEFDMQVLEAGNGSFYFSVVPEGYKGWYFVHPHRFQRVTADESNSGLQLNIGKTWHKYKVEVRGKYSTLYFDGRKIETITLAERDSNPPKANISFQLNTNHSPYKVNIGKVHYKPYFPEVELLSPVNQSAYVEGEDIVLKAIPDTDVEYVDYYLNGLKVGKGYAPSYEYTLQDVKVGTYNVTAGIGNNVKSAANKIVVEKAFTAELVLDKTVASNDETINASLNYSNAKGGVQPTKVEYLVDGNKVAESDVSPFSVVLGDIKIGSSRVLARVYDGNGSVYETDKIVTIYGTEVPDGKLAREYEIDYTYNSGSGEIEIADGYYKLGMSHSEDEITYETYTGTQVYALGSGKYKVAVVSGIAEVYYNGQYAYSFYMPRTSENEVSNSGVTDFKISGNGTKVRFISKEWKNESNFRIGGVTLPDYYQVEFDKTDASNETITIYDGNHKIPIEIKNGKINTVNYKTETGSHYDFVLNGTAKAGYYKLVVNKGLCQLYIDNQYVDSFKAIPNAGATSIERKMTKPTASTIFEVKGIDDVYYHDDDFNGNTEVDSLDYWIPDDDTITASLGTDGSDSYMKLEGTGTYLLNAQTYNTVIKWRAKAIDTNKFCIATRLFSLRHHLKVGYDFMTDTWFTDEFFDMVGTAHDPENDNINKRVDYQGTPMTVENWHDFELYLNGDSLILKMDGQVVIETDSLVSYYYGYVGFSTEEGTAYIDDFSYTGECGAFGALKSRVVNDPNGIKISDFVELSDKTVVAHYYSSQLVSYDKGETWNPENRRGYTSISLTLRNGTQLKWVREGTEMYCYASTDDCVTWEKRGSIRVREEHNDDRFIILNGSIDEADDGTIYLGIDEGYSELYSMSTILYSKDEGRTWHEAESLFGGVPTGEVDSTSTQKSGWNTQEITFETLPDGKTQRMFGRTGNGFIYYMDSTDGGKTWGEYRPTQLLHPLCTYNIEQDPDDPNVYYAITVHSANTESYYDIHQPRNRFVLLMSRDGMKSWEFVATLNETVTWRNFAKCNFATRVYGDTIYIVDNSLYEGNYSILYAIDKTKIKSRKRLESAHGMKRRHFVEGAGSIQFTERVSEMAYLPKTSGGAFILGNNAEIVVENGMYDAETICKVFGATVVKDSSAVTFTIGDGTVKFTEGSNYYTVNGVRKAYSEVCMRNGYLNIGACGEAFGKKVDDVDGMYVIDLK